MTAMHLRTLRRRRGWTQEDLCQRTQIAQNSISRLERDRSARPRWQTVRALAKAFAVDPLVIAFGPPRRKTRAASANGGPR
jgi:transcriptional regulator with XRE-family HTH domain